MKKKRIKLPCMVTVVLDYCKLKGLLLNMDDCFLLVKDEGELIMININVVRLIIFHKKVYHRSNRKQEKLHEAYAS